MSASTIARGLLAASGVSFLATGLVFFLLPGYSAENFPWHVSPFVAMTIGGWAIGTGAIALDAARRWNFQLVYPALIFVWIFAIAELLVVIGFLAGLRTDHWLTWPYLLSLVLGVASAAAGLPILWRYRAAVRTPALPVPTWVRFFTASFVVIVGTLSAITAVIVASGGSVFPEPLTAFTTRAFSAFFFSLVCGAMVLLFGRDLRSAVYFATVGNVLVVPITVAALVNLDKFNFGGRPGQLVYLGLYVATAVLATGAGLWYRRRYGGSFQTEL